MQTLPKTLAPLLLDWYAQNRRDLPWRRDREPYHVWLSEVMLQQTRVEAVRGYYARFLAELPDIASLAACDPDRLHKLWEGLGYYSRVRNLQKAAQVIIRDHSGQFPSDFDAIRALPGVGDYTAGAIGSICFELPTPAVDGNVLRVLARIMADETPINRMDAKKEAAVRLREIYPAGRCGDFTQSLMELGATVCVPNGAPHCGACPVCTHCLAHTHSCELTLPKKDAKKPRRIEEKTAFLFLCNDACAVRKRPDKGLLAGLWELPNVDSTLSPQQALDTAAAFGVQPRELLRSVDRQHIFTHIVWNIRCYTIRCAVAASCFTWADRARFAQDVALPTAFRQFLDVDAALS